MISRGLGEDTKLITRGMLSTKLVLIFKAAYTTLFRLASIIRSSMTQVTRYSKELSKVLKATTEYEMKTAQYQLLKLRSIIRGE